VPAKIENLRDVFAAEQGSLPAEKVRRVEVVDAMADTGATFLSLPKRYINLLGLGHYRQRRMPTSGGNIDAARYEAVRLTVQGRDCTVDVVEIGDDCPVLIGQIPLEAMDWVVDPRGQKLIGNPEHGGEWMVDCY
jgi:predicted aspartyl protease